MASATEEEIAKLRGSLQLARQQYQEGLFDKAEPVFKRALFFFSEGEELRQSLMCLTNIYAIQRNFAEALESAIGLLALNEKEFGKNDQRTIAVMKEIADIYMEAGQQQKAENMQRKAHAREKAAERGEIDTTDTSSTYKTLTPEPPEEPQPEEVLTPRERIQTYLDKLRPIMSALNLDLADYRTTFYAKAIGAAIVILLLICVAGFLPRAQTDLDVYSAISHNYETADHKAQFRLIDASHCVFQRNPSSESENKSDKASNSDKTENSDTNDDPTIPKKMEMAFSQYLPDWRDALSMTFGNIYEKEYSVQRRDDSVLDEENRVYYGQEGQEHKILEQMNDIRNAVDTFIKREGKYPDHLSAGMVRPHNNPFTSKMEMPTCQRLEVGNTKCTTAYSLEERGNLYRSLMDGHSWKDEPPLHPGAINTAYVLARSEAGEFYDFIVRGCDRHGKTLETSIPGKAYILSVSGAKEFVLPAPNVPFTGKLLVRPRRAWLIAPDAGSGTLYFIHHGLSFIWGLAGLCFLVFCLRKRFFLDEWKDSDYKFIAYTAGCAVMIMIYEFSLSCP